LICKENFNWQKYIDRYKDLKNINNLDTAWNHWCEEGKKQGRKFFTLAPFKNNKYYIITREYIKQKNIKLKSNKGKIIVSNLDDDVVIGDYVSNIKNKIKKFNKNKIFVCQTINQNVDENFYDKTNIKQENDKTNIKQEKDKTNIKQENDKTNIKQEKANIKQEKDKTNIKQKINQDKSNIKNDDIEILEKDIKYTCKKNQTKDEWTQKTENSEIFFIECDNNKDNFDNSSESKKYFSKKNPLNVFSNST
jgi:hypothetical protein